MKIKLLLPLLVILAFALMSTGNPKTNKGQNQCRYYAYILYGDASLTNNIKVKEKVYQESSIRKAKEGYKVCCNDYCSYKCAGFSVINIGPYESEAICYQELQKQINKVENLGYQPYERYKHMLISVLEFNYKKCD
ncbi:hypothetical protein [Pedobacter sp. ASV28]|uniref:hypothetical protein n=1 Tax=Pedobacter sp. ASV28 TaxID=2795123 RepID=UPI0018EBD1BF|nr:hypothetical protein [Pedobacter sp. ASV28]